MNVIVLFDLFQIIKKFLENDFEPSFSLNLFIALSYDTLNKYTVSIMFKG